MDKYSNHGLFGNNHQVWQFKLLEGIDSTKIYIIFIGLLLIISTAPDIASSESIKNLKETDFAHALYCSPINN